MWLRRSALGILNSWTATPSFFIERYQIRNELKRLTIFIANYFDSKLDRIVLFGSYLNMLRFNSQSDIDVAVILINSEEWHLVDSDTLKFKDRASNCRRDFYSALREFCRTLTRNYDIKIYTKKDLELIYKHDRYMPGPRGGNFATDISRGRIIFKNKEAR